MLLNKQDKIILKIIPLILIILFIKNQMSPQHFIEETIQSIVENEDHNKINAPKDFINDIESIYTFSKENGLTKPKYRFESDEQVEFKGKSYYRITFMSHKPSKDKKSFDFRVFNVLIEIERSFPKYRIINYRPRLNTYEE
jgi:hypothetical protein